MMTFVLMRFMKKYNIKLCMLNTLEKFVAFVSTFKFLGKNASQANGSLALQKNTALQGTALL